MAEEEAEAPAPKAVGTPPVKKGGVGNRLIYIIGGGVFLVVLLMVGLFFRPSFDSGERAASGSKYVRVFTNLELKEAAEIRAALDAQGIRDFKVEDNGRTIVVRRRDADNARLSMALEGLPSGGVIGFEIFDKGGALGATDFDKRIKLTRALNGELSRNISRIYGIDEARVQIVMPEKQLFATEKVPVTSAVFIKIAKGILLAPLTIKGVVHLVASSVEELATKNVTVVDYSGRILSSPDYAAHYAKWLGQQKQELQKAMVKGKKGIIALPVEEKIGVTEKISEKQLAAMTPKERMEARLRFKKDFEKGMEVKAQSILDQFFPKGASLIKINAELKSFDEVQQNNASAIARITSIILLDENNKQLVLTPETKEAVFKAVAAVTGYVRGRDRIDLRWAPIYQFEEVLNGRKEGPTRFVILGGGILGKILMYGVLLGVFLIIIKLVRNTLFKKGALATVGKDSSILSPKGRGAGDVEALRGPTLEDYRDTALKNPEKLADVLKAWLAE